MANLLAGMTDVELAALLNARGISPQAPWHDVFDAADALLTPESIRSALALLPREQANAVYAAASARVPLTGESLDTAHSLALVDAKGALFDEVRVLAGTLEFSASEPSDAAQADAVAELDGTAAAAAHAAELAFLTIARVADVVLSAQSRPLATLQNGGLRSTERKRLIEAGLEFEPKTLELLVALARDGGLLTTTGAAAHVSPAGSAWLERPFPKRWTQLAAQILARVPDHLVAARPAQWANAFPWNPLWAAQAEHTRAEFAALGVLDADGAWTPWGKALRESDAPSAIAALADHVPHEVDRVFVQHDYTIIAPGPLEPRLDLALRRFSDAAPGGHASGYRLSADSVSRALTAGLSADDMLGLLAEISLSGTPQPVEYLIRNAAERHGAVRVGAHPETGATIVTSDDALLLKRIAADRELRMLSLRAEETGLTTPVSPQNTHWALLDAGYPSLLSAEFASNVTAAAQEPELLNEPDYAALIEVIRHASSDDAGEAWLNRELELAARERSTIIVEVAMPDGSARELTLQVSAFSGGRLRGLDRSADVERTLPVSSIRSARPV